MNTPSVVEAEPNEIPPRALVDDICVHIFSSSSVMVGVCLTVVGILRVVITLNSKDTLGDDLLTIHAMV